MRFPFENQWTIPDNPPSNPDCFVIPSYALKDHATPTKPTKAQIELAADWWKRFPNSSLIMCTGDNQRLGLSNASVMADYAVELGVPPANVIEEDQSLNTYENLYYAMGDHPGEEFQAAYIGHPRPVHAPRRRHRPQNGLGRFLLALGLFQRRTSLRLQMVPDPFALHALCV